MLPTDLITTDEAALLLQVSESTIRRWRATGALTGYQVGKRLRFSRAAVEALVRPYSASEAAS